MPSDVGPGKRLPGAVARRLAAARRTIAEIPARDPAREIPLTPAQERLWFLDRAGFGGSIYLLWHTIRITGPLDLEALRTALATVVRRHEALRTSIVESGGRPRQVVHDLTDEELATLLPVEDFTGVPDAEERARRRTREILTTPFDLARAPLFRTVLLRLGEHDHALLMAGHHIICDGVSIEVMVAEWLSAYHATVTGEPEKRPQTAAAQFPDYAVWLADRDPETLRADREYWRQRLTGAPPQISLPTDRPRPAVPSGRGKRVSDRLPAEAQDRLAELMRRERCTPFVALLTAFAAALGRMCDQEDLVIGVPVANRDMVELAQSIGMYVNTLAVRTDLSGNPTLRELLRRCRERFLTDMDHQRFPFDQVVNLIKAPRDLARNPVYQVMLVVQPVPPDDGKPPVLPMEEWEAPIPSARFDLTLHVVIGNNGEVDINLDYAADLFDEPSAGRIRDHVERMLTVLATRPDTRVWNVELDTADPVPLTVAPPDPAARELRAHELIAQRAAETPDAPAVLMPGEPPLSYGELDRRANRLARELAAAGVGPGTFVGVILPPGPRAIVAILGVLYAGGAYLPLDPAHPPARRREILRAAGAVAAVTAGENDIGVPVILPPEEGADTPPAVRPGPDDPAYVIYTSGSTGRPKGVVVTHGTLSRFTASFIAVHGFGPGHRLLMLPPLTFDASVGDVFPGLVSGTALVFHPEPALLHAPELTRFCSEFGVTAVDIPAALWRRWAEGLARSGLPDDCPVRIAMIGGERVSMDSVREWVRATEGRIRLFNHYGPTEATVCATVHATVDGSEDGMKDATHLPIGRPLPHVRAYVCDRYGGRVPAGTPGELYLGGDCLARGYLGDPAMTAARFVPDPFAGTPGARMYRTGDLVRLRPGGSLEFLGRVDRQVKINGLLVEPAEIEAALTTHPAVTEAAVTALPGQGGHHRLVGYVTGGEVDELRRYLRERLPDYLVPGVFVHLDRLPRTSHDKVDYAALPDPGPAGTSGDTEPPRGPVETALARVWERVLGVERVGRHDNFFALGGHSLLAGELLTGVHEALGLQPTLRDLFETANLAELATVLAERGDAPDTGVDLVAEATPPEDLVVSGPAFVRHRPGTYLLTGGTGFLGAHLVAELLGRSSARVVCPVRADSPEHALARLRENLGRYGLARVADDPRLTALPGDLTEPRLGLSEETFARLAREVDAICHNGGQVSFALPYEMLRPANVGGTLEVLRLAALGGGVPVHLVSTLGVYLEDTHHGRPVSETDPPDDPAGLYRGYEQSKWVADRLARRARERGIPVTVHRPARICCDSRTGIGVPDDYFSRMLITCAQVGMVPDLSFGEDLAPVDRVAAGIAEAVVSGNPPAHDLHYFNPALVSYRQIAAELSERGHPAEAVPWARWRSAIRDRAASGEPVGLGPFVADLPKEEPVFDRPLFDCELTEKWLAGAGVAHAPDGLWLLGRCLDGLADAGRLS